MAVKLRAEVVPNPQSVWGVEAERRRIKAQINYLNQLLKVRPVKPKRRKK